MENSEITSPETKKDVSPEFFGSQFIMMRPLGPLFRNKFSFFTHRGTKQFLFGFPLLWISICIYIGPFCYFSTVFVDKRLWKTKHPRKRVQNFRQSCVLLTDRIKIHQSQPDSIWWQLVIAIDGFRSHLSITRKTEGKFGHVSVAVLFSKVVYQRKRW